MDGWDDWGLNLMVYRDVHWRRYPLLGRFGPSSFGVLYCFGELDRLQSCALVVELIPLIHL